MLSHSVASPKIEWGICAQGTIRRCTLAASLLHTEKIGPKKSSRRPAGELWRSRIGLPVGALEGMGGISGRTDRLPNARLSFVNVYRNSTQAYARLVLKWWPALRMQPSCLTISLAKVVPRQTRAAPDNGTARRPSDFRNWQTGEDRRKQGRRQIRFSTRSAAFLRHAVGRTTKAGDTAAADAPPLDRDHDEVLRGPLLR